MSIRVYHADVNPAVERFSFRQSDQRGEELVASGQGRFITLEDGRKAVQLYRTRAGREVWIDRWDEMPSDKPALAELPGLKFIPPITAPGPSLAAVIQGWDWSAEPA